VFKIAQTAFSLSAKFSIFSRLLRQRTMIMHSLFRRFTPLLLAVAIASPIAMIGCRPQETVNYNQWEHETNRPHKDLSERSPDEQKQYSDWQRDHH
jgi:hypothetical protein